MDDPIFLELSSFEAYNKNYGHWGKNILLYSRNCINFSSTKKFGVSFANIKQSRWLLTIITYDDRPHCLAVFFKSYLWTCEQWHKMQRFSILHTLILWKLEIMFLCVTRIHYYKDWDVNIRKSECVSGSVLVCSIVQSWSNLQIQREAMSQPNWPDTVSWRGNYTPCPSNPLLRIWMWFPVIVIQCRVLIWVLKIPETLTFQHGIGTNMVATYYYLASKDLLRDNIFQKVLVEIWEATQTVS